MLSKEHADDDFLVVSVSMDELESQGEALAFLQDQKAANFENLISKDGGSPQAFDSFDVPGGLPEYQLYDRQGKLRYRFSSFPEDVEQGESFELLDKRVEELLAEG